MVNENNEETVEEASETPKRKSKSAKPKYDAIQELAPTLADLRQYIFEIVTPEYDDSGNRIIKKVVASSSGIAAGLLGYMPNQISINNQSDYTGE